MGQTVLTNALVVTRDDAFSGTVVFDERGVLRVDTASTAVLGAVDCHGDLVIPGLIEMHTDNVERHLEPRPGVIWPSATAALMAHDSQMVGAGITTALDAISVGDYQSGHQRRELLKRTAEALAYGRDEGLFRSDHLMHLRCEVSDPGVVEMFEPYANDPVVRLVSVMDHTPGQRQWQDLEKMRQFHSRKRSYSDAEFAAYVEERQSLQSQHAAVHRKRVIELWSPRELPIASHDDTTREHVLEAAADGITIAEFPTTLGAASAAREHGMVTLMGSPNLVRGGSHSGNVSAGDLADRNLLDGLSSDYVPVSLLHGALKLADCHEFTTAAAMATVTCNIADMLGFDDRGEIALGKRADLARIRRLPEGTGAVRMVWREGVQVA